MTKIHFADDFFRLIVALPSSLPKSDKSSFSSSPSSSYSLLESSGNGGKCAIPATSVFHGSAGIWNLFVRRLIRGLPGAPEEGPGGVQLADVGQMTGLFPGSPGGTLGAPGDDGPCPEHC